MGAICSCFKYTLTIEEPTIIEDLPSDYFLMLDQLLFDQVKNNPNTQIWSIGVSDKWAQQIDDQFRILGVQIFSLGYNIRIDRTIKPFRSINHLDLIPNANLGLTYLLQISPNYVTPSLKEPGIFSIFYRGQPYISDSCVVCDDQLPMYVILPCGHLCLCQSCAKTHYIGKQNSCPICSFTISDLCPYLDAGFCLDRAEGEGLKVKG